MPKWCKLLQKSNFHQNNDNRKNFYQNSKIRIFPRTSRIVDGHERPEVDCMGYRLGNVLESCKTGMPAGFCYDENWKFIEIIDYYSSKYKFASNEINLEQDRSSKRFLVCWREGACAFLLKIQMLDNWHTVTSRTFWKMKVKWKFEISAKKRKKCCSLRSQNFDFLDEIFEK